MELMKQNCSRPYLCPYADLHYKKRGCLCSTPNCPKCCRSAISLPQQNKFYAEKRGIPKAKRVRKTKIFLKTVTIPDEIRLRPFLSRRSCQLELSRCRHSPCIWTKPGKFNTKCIRSAIFLPQQNNPSAEKRGTSKTKKVCKTKIVFKTVTIPEAIRLKPQFPRRSCQLGRTKCRHSLSPCASTKSEECRVKCRGGQTMPTLYKHIQSRSCDKYFGCCKFRRCSPSRDNRRQICSQETFRKSSQNSDNCKKKCSDKKSVCPRLVKCPFRGRCMPCHCYPPRTYCRKNSSLICCEGKVIRLASTSPCRHCSSDCRFGSTPSCQLAHLPNHTLLQQGL